MKRVILVFVAFMSYSTVTFAQKAQTTNDQSREAICDRVRCRKAQTLTLKISEKEIAEFEFPEGPFVADGYISVLSGEEIYVEFDVGTDGFVNARYVDKLSVPGKTVTFRLDQIDDEAILTVKNPFAQRILYDCLIQHYKAPGLKQTSILPVESKLLGIEAWPFAIPQVVISHVRFYSFK